MFLFADRRVETTPINDICCFAPSLLKFAHWLSLDYRQVKRVVVIGCPVTQSTRPAYSAGLHHTPLSCASVHYWSATAENVQTPCGPRPRVSQTFRPPGHSDAGIAKRKSGPNMERFVRAIYGPNEVIGATQYEGDTGTEVSQKWCKVFVVRN